MAGEPVEQVVAGATAVKRDWSVIGLVGVAHLTSHMGQLALPPLFPLLIDEFGVGYSALGLIVALFYAASGIGQALVGILVDRHGGRPILVAGLVLLAGGLGLMAYAPSYWVLLPLAIVAGLGNSVFHPADFSILSHAVSHRRVGRAFSIHAFAGTIGYALAPVVMAGIAFATSWRWALSALAAFGLVIALALVLSRGLLDTPHALERPAPRGEEGAVSPFAAFVRLLRMPVMLMAFAYLTLVALAATAMHTYGAAAMVAIHHVPYAVAAGVVSAYLVGTASGILIGGPIADRTTRHDRVAMAGLVAAAALMTIAGAGDIDFSGALVVVALAGAAVGITSAARDMLVKAAAPKGATGKVFGLVYSGFDIGSMAAPILLGWLIDRGLGQTVLLAIAATWLVTTLSVIQVRQRTLAMKAA